MSDTAAASAPAILCESADWFVAAATPNVVRSHSHGGRADFRLPMPIRTKAELEVAVLAYERGFITGRATGREAFRAELLQLLGLAP